MGPQSGAVADHRSTWFAAIPPCRAEGPKGRTKRRVNDAVAQAAVATTAIDRLLGPCADYAALDRLAQRGTRSGSCLGRTGG